jgi:hypothetical protein
MATPSKEEDMSQGKTGYVPGGFKLTGGYQTDGTPPAIVLKYTNAKGETFRRIVYKGQKGWPRARVCIRWLADNHMLG